MPNRHFRMCMIINCGHKCQKTLNDCIQCVRTRVETKGPDLDEKIRVVQAWGYEV